MRAASSPETAARAGAWALLGQLLLHPDPALLRWLAGLPVPPPLDGPDPLGEAWSALLQAARAPDAAQQAAKSWQRLFVALGTPAIDPYASRYLDGSLMAHALLALRRELQALGLERSADSHELEDHLGALCEAMGQLVLRQASQAVQRDFLQRHIGTWAGRCLDDIATHPQAGFYAVLAGFGRVFVDSEQSALSDATGGAQASTVDA